MSIESTRELQDHPPVLAAIQYLRGIAAALVVVSHCYLYLAERRPGFEPYRLLQGFGALGVAIFFIISGFIMYFTCRTKWSGSAASARDFVQRRLHRIVPLYWLLTAATMLLGVIASLDGDKLDFTGGDAVRSLLFVPYGFNGIKFRPVLGVGWTLDFEMFFYALFAIGLLLPRRRGIPLVLAMIAGFIALGQAGLALPGPIAALAQPIICLFGLGILLGWARDRIAWRLPPGPGAAILLLLVAASPAMLWLTPPAESQLWPNPGIWAFSLLAVTVGAFTVARPARDRSLAARLGLALGDASYLLYLAHPLVILVLGEIAERLGPASAAGMVGLAVVMFLASVAVALFGHILVERPLNRWTAPLFGRRRKPPLADATTPPAAT